jgi:CPA2 family monovalent cation:H+ antiporter-2
MRRLLGRLILDAGCLAGIILGASLSLDRVAALIETRAGIGPENARAVIVMTAAVVSIPFCVGIARCARRLGVTMATEILPLAEHGKVDLALAPRRALVVTMQLACVVIVGAPLVAVTQPFLPPLRGAAVFALVLGGMGIAFWRSATNLEGHVRAGAQAIVEVIAAQSKGSGDAVSAGAEGGEAEEAIRKALPGLGDPAVIRLGGGSNAVGKTLAELDLRGLTGATVLALAHEGEGVSVPTGREILRAGDVLAVAGARDAVAAAEALLVGPPEAREALAQAS